jgi:hypothetical protein
MKVSEVFTSLREMDDVHLTQSQLFDREEAQAGFQLLRDQHVSGLSPCLRWKELLVAWSYGSTQVPGRIATAPYPTSAKERRGAAQNESDRLQILLAAHQKNCSQCRVFPQSIPFPNLLGQPYTEKAQTLSKSMRQT